jgi:hypothetical protein
MAYIISVWRIPKLSITPRELRNQSLSDVTKVTEESGFGRIAVIFNRFVVALHPIRFEFTSSPQIGPQWVPMFAHIENGGVYVLEERKNLPSKPWWGIQATI